eukprot:7603894-Alexandrium_andersonii.AAC.1
MRCALCGRNVRIARACCKRCGCTLAGCQCQRVGSAKRQASSEAFFRPTPAREAPSAQPPVVQEL